MERAPRWESEGRSRLVIEGSVRATADGMGDGMTAATSPLWVRAFVRPSPSLQQSSAFAELPVTSDLAQHAIRACADASQPTHTVATVGMNPIRSARAVTTAIRREHMGSIVDVPSRTVKSENESTKSLANALSDAPVHIGTPRPRATATGQLEACAANHVVDR